MGRCHFSIEHSSLDTPRTLEEVGPANGAVVPSRDIMSDKWSFVSIATVLRMQADIVAPHKICRKEKNFFTISSINIKLAKGMLKHMA